CGTTPHKFRHAAFLFNEGAERLYPAEILKVPQTHDLADGACVNFGARRFQHRVYLEHRHDALRATPTYFIEQLAIERFFYLTPRAPRKGIEPGRQRVKFFLRNVGRHIYKFLMHEATLE